MISREKVERSYVNATKGKVLVFKDVSFSEVDVIMTINEWMLWVEEDKGQQTLKNFRI